MAGEATCDSRRATTGATCDSRHSTVGCRSSSVVGRRAVAPLSVVARRLSLRCRLSAVVALSAAGRRMSPPPGCRSSAVKCRRPSVVGRRLSNVVAIILAFLAFSVHAESAYTNHAGNIIAGWPVKLTQKEVALAEGTTNSQLSTTNSQLSTFNFQLSTTNTYPLSIFPESEQRRIAADFGQPRVPLAVKRAITGADKAMARSRKRAEKGLCTQEESDAFCAKSEAALKSYLDKQVKEGTITPAERKALRR